MEEEDMRRSAVEWLRALADTVEAGELSVKHTHFIMVNHTKERSDEEYIKYSLYKERYYTGSAYFINFSVPGKEDEDVERAEREYELISQVFNQIEGEFS